MWMWPRSSTFLFISLFSFSLSLPFLCLMFHSHSITFHWFCLSNLVFCTLIFFLSRKCSLKLYSFLQTSLFRFCIWQFRMCGTSGTHSTIYMYECAPWFFDCLKCVCSLQHNWRSWSGNITSISIISNKHERKKEESSKLKSKQSQPKYAQNDLIVISSSTRTHTITFGKFVWQFAMQVYVCVFVWIDVRIQSQQHIYQKLISINKNKHDSVWFLLLDDYLNAFRRQ